MKNKFFRGFILTMFLLAVGTSPSYADDDAAEPDTDGTDHTSEISPVTGEEAEVNISAPSVATGEDAESNFSNPGVVTGEEGEVNASPPNVVVGEEAAPNVDVGGY